MWTCEYCSIVNKTNYDKCGLCKKSRKKDFENVKSKRDTRKKERDGIYVREARPDITEERSNRDIQESDYYEGSSISSSIGQTRSTTSKEKCQSQQKLNRKPVYSCDPCSCIEEVKATHYCETCDEFYCANCTVIHNCNKSASNHDVVKVLTDCEPCHELGEINDASHFCENCAEHLCAECSRFHLAQEQLKNHKIIKLKSLMCVFCERNGLSIKATKFCRDCEPETAQLFCNKCGKRHTAMKLFKNHILSRHLSSLFSRLRKKPLVPVEQNDKTLNSQTDPDKVTTVKKNEKIRLEKPYVTTELPKSDQMELKWKDNGHLRKHEVYQITFQENNGKWQNYKQTTDKEWIIITGLRSSTVYFFRVRVKNEETGDDGFLSQPSEPITTRESIAQKIMKTAEKIKSGCPSIYKLPIQEDEEGKNTIAKTRKFTLGEYNTSPSKTMMIVGATGSGKSTLINAMANYVLGVNWEDEFRFELIHLDKTEAAKVNNQALSQTDWVTCYTLYSCAPSRTQFTINLIDTPGFGDCRGIDQDKRIVDQMRALFTSKGKLGVDALNAVCFILKAPDARLTVTQTYIFDSILSLFGNDIRDNICTLITFADGNHPPVLAALKALKDNPLPISSSFLFNNSALYVDNSSTENESLSPIFWQMGEKSCRDFFSKLPKFKEKSLTLTAEVLINREKLENTICSLQLEIDVGLTKINELEHEIKIFINNRSEIMANKDFSYEVEESRPEKTYIGGKGQHTTHCLQCNFTCHNNCAYSDDDDKANCIAMNNSGSCTVCPRNCHWTVHKNLPYIVKWITQKISKTYYEKQQKYQAAEKKKISLEQVLKAMHQEIQALETGIQIRLTEITDLTNKLEAIALRHDPLSTGKYIELLIESEKREKKAGFCARIGTLEKCKKRAQFGKDVKIFHDRLEIVHDMHNSSVGKQNENSTASNILEKFKAILFNN